MSECLVAVDVGNSAIKLCVRQPAESLGDDALRDHSIRIDQAGWDAQAINWVHEQLGCQSVQWRIASVHRSAANQLRHAIVESRSDASIHLITRHDVPMQVRVDHPDRLGIDRLAGAHGAHNRFGAPLVMVDAGSAVTVDWVNSEGEFCGGAILPGLALQFAALASGTDGLPRIDGSLTRPPQIPGKNTSEAIRLGVISGIAAGIDRLAQCYGQEAKLAENEYSMVLTGGDAAVISPLLTHSHRVIKNLVCRGLLDLPRSTVAATNRQKELE